MPGRDIPWSRWIPKLVTIFVVLLLIALILPAIQQAREAARRSANQNNLKQFGLAFSNYHDVHKYFPPGGIVAEDGTGYHGWYTFLMPFICTSPDYNMIDFNSPWTDPVNEPVFLGPYFPPGEHNPKIDLKFTSDGYGLLHYSAHSRLLHRNSSVSLDEIDGLARTWMVSDIFADWQPWGSPFNWHDLDWPLPGCDEPHGWSDSGAHLLFADGHLEFVGRDADPSVIASLHSGAADVAAELMEKPHVRYTYTEDGPGIKWRSIRPSDEKPSTMSVYFGKDGEPTHLKIRNGDKFEDRDVTPGDLKFAIEDCPDARTIRAEIDLDDDVARILQSTPQLECLHVDAIRLTGAGIEQFQELRSLRILKGSATREMAETLKLALPDCELRIAVRPLEAQEQQAEGSAVP